MEVLKKIHIEILAKFDTYITLQGIPDDRRIQVFTLLMKGPADVWMASLPAAIRNNWALLRTAFTDAFVGANTELLLAQMLDSRVQGPTESAESYINDILRMTQRLQKGLRWGEKIASERIEKQDQKLLYCTESSNSGKYD